MFGAKAAFLRSEFPGAAPEDVVVRSTPAALAAQAAAAAPGGLDCVLDSLGGAFFKPVRGGGEDEDLLGRIFGWSI